MAGTLRDLKAQIILVIVFSFYTMIVSLGFVLFAQADDRIAIIQKTDLNHHPRLLTKGSKILAWEFDEAKL